MKPTVSVLMCTYRHADFVAEAIESVLVQQDVDFEFLIADDGSPDNTADVVRQFTDPRIKFLDHKVNRGACITGNELIRLATGEYIALLNSDDRWTHSDKLARQVAFMEANPDFAATFGRASFMDKQSKPLAKETVPLGDIFDKENRSQAEWLRYFFEQGNCICHPTMLIRRRCYEELGLYDNRLRQLPDFDMWVRLIKRHPIHVSDREEITFRLMPGENTSSQTRNNAIRTMNEHYLIGKRFFSGVNADMLRGGFTDLLTYPDLPSDEHVDIEKALLFLKPNVHGLALAYGFLGLDALHDLLASPSHRKLLIESYNIDDLWLQNRYGEYALFRPDLMYAEQLASVQATIHELKSAVEVAQAANLALLNSTSWKITSGLRWLSGKVRTN